MAQDDKFFLASTVSGEGTTLGGITANEIGVLDAVDLPTIVISRECKVARINRAATTVLGLNRLGSRLFSWQHSCGRGGSQ